MIKLKILISVSIIALFYSCDLLKSYNGELISLKDCPQEIDGMSVKLHTTKHPIYTETIDRVSVSRDGSWSECKFDAIWTKNLWDGRIEHGYGDYYFVDANFDGNLDVFFGGGESTRGYIVLWNTNEEKFHYYKKLSISSLRCSVFSPSEKAMYGLYRSDRDLLYRAYLKSEWIEDELLPIECLYEVLTDDGGDIDKVRNSLNNKISHKYTIYSYNPKSQNEGEIIEEYNDIDELPNNWKDVIAKMKKDYPLEKMLKEKPEQIEIVFESVKYNSKQLSYYRSETDEAWVDMGVLADDSTQLLWAKSDLIIRDDNTLGLSEYACGGNLFGWGDASGKAQKSSSEYRFYGGDNPPSSITGNPKYDIVSAYFGSSTRLPTKAEWMRLLENCERIITTIKRELPSIGEDGLPSWVQGQWMTQMRVGNSVLSTSIKIDGIGGSIIATQGGTVIPLYDGTFNYDRSSGLLTMGDYQLQVHSDRQIITTGTGEMLQKVSNDTDSQKVDGLMLTSKINGEKLFFPISSEISYWSATVATENVKAAYMFNIKASIPVDVGIGYMDRNKVSRIRPVSSNVIPVTIGYDKK